SAIFAKGEAFHPPGLNVDQEGDLLEGDEGNAERQDDVQKREVGAEGVVDRAGDEVGVFEEAEIGDVEQKADDEHEPRQAGRVALLAQPEQERGDKIVDDDRRPDDEDVERPPRAIEDERSQDEPQDRPLAGDAAEKKEPDEGRRQKHKQEFMGVEQHGRLVLPATRRAKKQRPGGSASREFPVGSRPPHSQKPHASILVVSLTIAPTLGNDSMSATLNFTPNSISTATMKLM